MFTVFLLLGFVFTGTGVLLLLTAVLPNFGGRNDEASFPLGLLLSGAGLALIFYAGSLT